MQILIIRFVWLVACGLQLANQVTSESEGCGRQSILFTVLENKVNSTGLILQTQVFCIRHRLERILSHRTTITINTYMESFPPLPWVKVHLVCHLKGWKEDVWKFLGDHLELLEADARVAVFVDLLDYCLGLLVVHDGGQRGDRINNQYIYAYFGLAG